MSKLRLCGLAAAALLAATPVALAAEGQSVTIVSWGGTTQDGLRKTMWAPIAEELGITLKEDTLNSNADIRAQVQSGSVTWDIVDIGSAGCVQLAKEGVLEEVDYGKIDTAGLPARLINKNWVGFYYFSTLLAWNKDEVEKEPTGWKDFWDVENFPGPRALRNDTAANLEYALLADGVPIDQLYPLDVDRAFRKLEEIKPHVKVWWTAGAQSMQLATSGEAAFLSMWNARVPAANKQGGHVGYTYNQATLDFECLLVPKGAPNKELAWKVIDRLIAAKYQAAFPVEVPYGPVNEQAFALGTIPAELLPLLPSAPENAKVQALVDPEWWLEHGPAVTERFQAFLQQ